ncbi:MAG: aminoacyl-histidine dipeptidase [Bacteroidales bacterium]|nr:aminoacyl-histidine dipeptidase [Bacteroidales bacterium]
MSDEILKLQPKEVWNNFYQLTQIPRPSKKEQKIIAFMKQWGENLGLETIVDGVGNVIIRKPATPGMEDRKGIVLQAHLDMVPQKNSDVDHDFEKDPIDAYIDGEWVTARGTTLGADNGMGVAAAMAVLESKTIKHGLIEGLFTIDEETGMTGAFGLKAGILKGDILMNLDSEDEGELYVGCAGGTNANLFYDYQEESIPAGYKGYKINIAGLKGGHSGVDIYLGKGNANVLLARFFYEAGKKFNAQIVELEGGNMRNAIPREGFAVVAVAGDKANDFVDFVKTYEKTIQNEYKTIDPDLTFTAESVDVPGKMMNAGDQLKFVSALVITPSGVIRMSNDMKGLVETSTNLSIVIIRNGKAEVRSLLRSSVDSAKYTLQEVHEAIYKLIGARTEFDGEYPGWKPNMASPILKAMQEQYNNLYGKIPEIKAIHAGLECGLLGGVYTNWDMISFGPTIRYPHSPDEKVNIETVQKFWNFLLHTLENAPK